MNNPIDTRILSVDRTRPVNFERIVILISNSYRTIFSYKYFHIDCGLRRKQYLRYRQRILEKSFYCVRKKVKITTTKNQKQHRH